MKTYDPQKVVMIIGTHTVVGYADGTFISASRNEDSVMYEPGADGGGTRVRNANKSGRFTFTLKKSSPSNDYLAVLHQLDEDSGQGIVPVMVKDNGNLQGRAIASAQNAWIVKPADFERGKELGDVEWILETDNLISSAGGVTDIVPA